MSGLRPGASSATGKVLPPGRHGIAAGGPRVAPVRVIGMRRQELECQGTVTTAGTTLALNPDMRSRIVLQLVLLPLLLCTVPGAYAGVEDPEAIRSAAAAAVRQRAGNVDRVHARAAALDPRLRLPQCSQPLVATPGGDGALRAEVPVTVRCVGERPWSLYLVVRVESDVPVLVARRALPRDSAPGPADFAMETRRVAGLAGQYVGNPSALEGRRLRRPIGVGEVLALDALVVAPVIHRGDQVMLVARGPAVEIRVAAIALADGRPEERVRVQNAASQRVIEGVVRGPGLVEVPL